MQPNEKPSLFDSLFSAIGDAITDIRHKYEESVYGRTVTDTPTQSHYAEKGLPPSFDDYRASRDAPQKEHSQEQDKGRELGD